MDSTDLKANSFFTKDGKDIWELLDYYLQSSCRMKNFKTGQEEDFAMGSLMAQRFHRIKMPETPSTVPIGAPESPQAGR